MPAFETIPILPDVSRIMEGLRDTGYNFNTAVSDIVDNSISADASIIRIAITRRFDGDIRVSIADNGHGMDKAELMSAMRYGAPERENNHSLGKFGLGLKTASTSCCRRLKVCSRNNPNDDILCAVWDLDFIASSGNKNGEWLLRFERPKDADLDDFECCAADGSGTTVIWENCDRILSKRYSNPTTDAYQRAFDRTVESLRFHLSMTFQRFLDSTDERAANIALYLNGEQVAPWDPFCSDLDNEYQTYYGSDCATVKLEDGSTLGNIPVRFFIVPNRDDLKSTSERQRVMPSYKNESLRAYSEESLSGFFVYRENRLIHWGDWLGIPGVDFHAKLCRFELSFDAELDDFFQVDIKKSRILLNEELRSALHSMATPFKNEGTRKYRKKRTTESKKASTGIHASSNTTIKSIEGNLIPSDTVTQTDDSHALIKNRFGSLETTYTIHTTVNGEDIALDTKESLEDGVLWEPALLNGAPGVLLNAGHEFYQKFYALNKDNSTATDSMDYVFWALAQAENQALSADAQENLRDSRYEASRYLKKVSKFLPEVSVEDVLDNEGE